MERQIITHFSDQDLYSFTVGLFYLTNFSESIGRYSFVDRNETVYPDGFADEIMRQVNMLDNLTLTEEEIEFIRSRCGSYMYSWFFTFLKGLRIKSDEVNFWQDKQGHLHGKVNGPLWRTIYWEQLLLAIVSELYHENDPIDEIKEYKATFDRASSMIDAGVCFSDMGTRRRFSKENHRRVINACIEAQEKSLTKNGVEGFVGTSNVWLAMQAAKEHPWIKCMGTMSHQMISAIAAIYGPREANFEAIERWNKLYRGKMGIYLIDCLGTEAFYKNFSKQNAKLLDGYRIDSGDNMAEFLRIKETLESFNVNPEEKTIVFSNGLQPQDAIDLHKKVAGRMKDTYGIGTSLTCNIKDVEPSNIVIKLTGIKLTPRHEMVPCIKISSDKGKATGDIDTIDAYKVILGI